MSRGANRNAQERARAAIDAGTFVYIPPGGDPVTVLHADRTDGLSPPNRDAVQRYDQLQKIGAGERPPLSHFEDDIWRLEQLPKPVKPPQRGVGRLPMDGNMSAPKRTSRAPRAGK